MDLTTSFGSSLSFCNISNFTYQPDEQDLEDVYIALPGFKQMIPFSGCFNKAKAESKTDCATQGHYIVDAMIDRLTGVNVSLRKHWLKVKECMNSSVKSELTNAQVLQIIKEHKLFCPDFIPGATKIEDAKKACEERIFKMDEKVNDLLVRIDAQVISSGYETQNLIKLLPSIFRKYVVDSYEKIMARDKCMYNTIPPDGKTIKSNLLSNILELRFSAIMEMLLMSYYNMLIIDMQMRSISQSCSISLIPLMLGSLLFLKNDCTLACPDLDDDSRAKIREWAIAELKETYTTAHGLFEDAAAQIKTINAMDDNKLMLLSIGLWSQSQNPCSTLLNQFICRDMGISYSPSTEGESLMVALGESSGRLNMKVSVNSIDFFCIKSIKYRDRVPGFYGDNEFPTQIEIETEPVLKLTNMIIPCYALATTLIHSDRARNFRTLVKYLCRVGALKQRQKEHLISITFPPDAGPDSSDFEDLDGKDPLPDTRRVVDLFCLFIRDQAFTGNSLQERSLLSMVSSWMMVAAH